MALVANRLKLWIFSFWLDCCLELFHDNVKIDLVILNTKDSCDGSVRDQHVCHYQAVSMSATD